ncbi:MAG: hypothetical protein R3C49_23045 [Planctomycetaceae bacterium]
MFRTCFFLVFGCCIVNFANAQGLRVSTVVYDAAHLDANGREPVVNRSISLFHAGRVYDSVEAAGEVVIFEPAAHKFVILNQRQGVTTTVMFQELQRLLAAREPRMSEYLNELREQRSPEAERATRTLEFQLHPEFRDSYDARSGILSLTAASWKYSVSTRAWDDPDQLQRYLSYTDWTARLNYILHPSSLFPEPRLILNEHLRSLKTRIPVVVQLDLRPDDRIVMRAEHQFVRDLTDHDRSQINEWNSLLQSGKLREVPFRSYQESLLVSQRR